MGRHNVTAALVRTFINGFAYKIVILH